MEKGSASGLSGCVPGRTGSVSGMGGRTVQGTGDSVCIQTAAGDYRGLRRRQVVHYSGRERDSAAYPDSVSAYDCLYSDGCSASESSVPTWCVALGNRRIDGMLC